MRSATGLVALPLALAKDPHRIACSGLLVGNRQLDIVLRNRARLIEFLEALQVAGCQIHHASRGNQVRVGRKKSGLSMINRVSPC